MKKFLFTLGFSFLSYFALNAQDLPASPTFNANSSFMHINKSFPASTIAHKRISLEDSLIRSTFDYLIKSTQNQIESVKEDNSDYYLSFIDKKTNAISQMNSIVDSLDFVFVAIDNLNNIISKSSDLYQDLKLELNSDYIPPYLFFQKVDTLLADFGYSYSPQMYLYKGLASKKLDCDTYSTVYLAIAETVDIPITWVSAYKHAFLRYEDDDSKIYNWESTSGKWHGSLYYSKSDTPLPSQDPKDILYLAYVAAGKTLETVTDVSFVEQRIAFLSFKSKIMDITENKNIFVWKRRNSE